MRWNVAANFFSGVDDRWLDDFIEDDTLEFAKILPVEQHDWHRGGMHTGVGQWRQHMTQARAAIADQPDGVVTCFPQLAFCVALLKRLGMTRARIVAHNFNLGTASGRLRGWTTGRVLSAVDRFLVHSPVEVERYARWLSLPRERFEFVPLQRGDVPASRPAQGAEPYILAMGSAHRDYGTLLEAARRLGYPVKIVCKASIAETLDPPANVEVLSDLSREECWSLLAGARISATPVSNLETASGQVTFVDAMRLGAPLLVTRCPGSEGYVEHLETGILVEPFDVDEMALWLGRLWDDAELRERLSGAARAFYDAQLSDGAAAERLRRVLRAVGGPEEAKE